jgi:hypothetical protein
MVFSYLDIRSAADGNAGSVHGGFDRSSAETICTVVLYLALQISANVSYVAAIGCGDTSMYLIGNERMTCNSIAPERADHNDGSVVEDWSAAIAFSRPAWAQRYRSSFFRANP